MSDLTLPDTPQFTTAEYAGQPGADSCKFCKQALTESYFRLNGNMACSNCVAQVKLKVPVDNHGAFTRGLLFGVGGAILGLILYAVFGIVTGLMVGYVALAVGWIVGKAMMMGSGGIGGRRYQIAAVVLTYAAVSMAAVPIYIAQASKSHKTVPAQQQQTVQSTANPSPGNASVINSQSSRPPKSEKSVGAVLAILAFVGLASPFLELADPIHGIIGLVILFVGLQFAWKMTRGASVNILGPFKLTPTSPNQGSAA